jgi:hypothetical protein
LGVTTYTGKSIVEHIEELRAKQKDLYDALEMYRHYRDSHMGASSSKVTQAYRGEMNDKIDAALRKARGDSE